MEWLVNNPAAVNVGVAMKVLAGALAGGVGGYALSRAKSRRPGQPAATATRIYYVLAGAFFGAALTWHFLGD
ncbi:MAG: hypothetical protein ACLFVU_12375 [Phycisphaerae bacterium]